MAKEIKESTEGTATSLPADLETIASLKATIEELNELLAAAESSSNTRENYPIGKIGKTAFEVVYPKLNIGGRVHTAQQVADDSSLLGELVKSGSAAVREVKS